MKLHLFGREGIRMNLKKAKKIRQEFRTQGTDVRERGYTAAERRIGSQGVLVVACPRYQYKKVKGAMSGQ
jgi:hypothetical protein